MEVGMVSSPDGPTLAVYIRLQLQNMKDEAGGTTQTCTARSNERCLKIGWARVVKVRKFSSQILLPQTTRTEEWQCRGTIRNTFVVQTKPIFKCTSRERVCFLLSSTYQVDAIPKSSPSGPALSILDIKALHMHSC